MHDVTLTYITGRGRWYNVSWKGSDERSGGVVTNIGIHFFDLLLWLFGGVESSGCHYREPTKAGGSFSSSAHVSAGHSRPISRTFRFPPQAGGKTTFRSIQVDGPEVEFSEGFVDLHTKVYADVLGGGGFGIDDARPAIELAYQIRTAQVQPAADAVAMGALR